MLDQDGYPTEETLLKIKEWDYHDFPGLMAFVESIWWQTDWGWHRKGKKYRISTGGWSGNESLVGAMEANWLFWTMCWQSSRRGGHYEFEIKKRKAERGGGIEQVHQD